MSALCTARLLGPMRALIDERNADPALLPEALRSARPDDRAPVEQVHGAMEQLAEHFQDEQLGLQLGQRVSLGELGPFDYLLRTASTASDALACAQRYSTLHGDRYRVHVERFASGRLLLMRDESSWPRTIADLCMSATFRLHVRERLPFTSRLEAWFPYPAPKRLELYERLFQGVTLRFNADCYAFFFDAGYERAPQPGADPAVHALLRERFDAVLRDVAQQSALAFRVRRALEQCVQQSREPSAAQVARMLHTSERTLSRRLQEEGTSFTEAREAMRQEYAVQQVRHTQRALAEIAFVLGYAHVESFHRAFKRWTGHTPLHERSAQRSA